MSTREEYRADFTEARETFEDEQPIHALRDDEPLADLLRTVLTELDDLDDEIATVFDGRFIETATGDELDFLASTVNIQRKTDETDERLRRRVRGVYEAAQSTGTYEDVAQVALFVLDADPEQVNLDPARETVDPATAVVEVEDAVINDSPFTEAEIERLLRRSAVGGHRLTLQRSNVFTWGDPDLGWGTKWG